MVYYYLQFSTPFRVLFCFYMQPNQQSMQGDLSALKQVMQQQGMGQAGVLNQNNPAASVPTQGQPTPQGSPMPQGAQQAPQGISAQQTAPQGQGLPAGDPEAQTILKALSSRLQTLGKLGR